MSVVSQTMKLGLASKLCKQSSNQLTRTLTLSSTFNKPTGNGKKENGMNSFKAVPRNVEEMKASSKAKFSPLRTRDSSSARIEAKVTQPNNAFGRDFMGSQGAKENARINTKSRPTDSHVNVYDVNSSVSLSSVMQSTVPQPFQVKGKKETAHLNMPGGQWAQGEKYLSGDQHAHHSKNIPKKYSAE